MKKTGYITLLLILILQSGGMMFIYIMQQVYVQQQTQKKLESSETVYEKLILTASEYEKCRLDEEEIYLNGNMYDVKSIKFFGDTVELFAINDSKETNILKRIKNLAKNTALPNSKLPNSLNKFISLVYVPPFSQESVFTYSSFVNLYYQVNTGNHFLQARCAFSSARAGLTKFVFCFIVAFTSNGDVNLLC